MIKIKEIFDFIISLVTTWKLIFPIILIIFAAIGNLFNIGKRIIEIALPLWVLLIISLFAFFPIAKLIIYILKRKSKSYKKLYGLLWKKPFLFFQNPQPYCPLENCDHQVICRFKPPKIYQAITSISNINNIDYEGLYFYECPIHGQLNGIPNEDITVLQKKARMALKKE
jgi:hypothetical protein